ncbi:UNVERIFIED_CONTAM: hypothetical protein OHV15_14580 [Microbacterium sp. SLM126]
MRLARRGSKLTRKGLAVGALAASLVLGAIAPAFAEGSWRSYIDAGRPGFQSRTWADNNTDSVGTKIWHTSCRADSSNPVAVTSVVYRLEKLTLLVENRGTASYSCSGYREYTWARQPAGSYRFVLASVNGGYTDGWRKVDVPSIGVNY